MCSNYDEEESLAWKKWRETTEFFSVEQLNDVVNRVDLQDVDEVKSFIMKFDNIGAFIDAGIVLVKDGEHGYYAQDFINDELNDVVFCPIGEEKDIKVLEVNRYFDEDMVVQLHLRTHERFDIGQIELSEMITDKEFPIFARVCLMDSWDRMGDITIREIGFFELSSYVKHPVQVS